MNTHFQLIEKWKSARPEYVDFVNDGILIPDDWNAAFPRICYILKESNDDFINIAGNKWGPDGNSKLFWRNLRIWRYIITEICTGNMPVFETAIAEKEIPLSDIAYLNLKKKAEHKCVSNDRDIQHYVDHDWNFIKDQIIAISPDIICCCSTCKYIRGKEEITRHGDHIYCFQNIPIIDFYHPSGRKSYRSTFEELVSILKSEMPTSGCSVRRTKCAVR